MYYVVCVVSHVFAGSPTLETKSQDILASPVWILTIPIGTNRRFSDTITAKSAWIL